MHPNGKANAIGPSPAHIISIMTPDTLHAPCYTSPYVSDNGGGRHISEMWSGRSGGMALPDQEPNCNDTRGRINIITHQSQDRSRASRDPPVLGLTEV
ncbi:hypothetical protein GDO81_011710 [Engystomops pustulosus]|uniref:Uncharacterized protein n=1 Tax=Engystomops pustulosus TaxID=76066 RepID=A0AAV7BG59_ENGPU|nr:hypothetical protein GDO81_011710 [Engystomops pustulosus]